MPYDVVLFEIGNGKIYVGKKNENSKIQNVYELHIIPNEQQMQIGIAPIFAGLIDKEDSKNITVDLEDVIMFAKADPQIEQQYLQITSGLSIVNPSNQPPNLKL